MMISVPGVLTPEQVRDCRERLEAAAWADGKHTAGFQSAMAKDNLQLPAHEPAARLVGELIQQALARHPLFVAAALPARVFPPLFNLYRGGQSFGLHVDNALRALPDGSGYLRTDLSATLFFCEPDEYDGGELVVEDTYGAHRVKLAAGDLILYPASSLHRVLPVTRGARLCSFFWVQSLVRDEGQRSQLFELDQGIQRAAAELGQGHEACLQLTGVYHNLLRQWAQP